ncbi:hypothetical protein B5F35_17790, partial [Anaeromassilibacillus sp. An200]
PGLSGSATSSSEARDALAFTWVESVPTSRPLASPLAMFDSKKAISRMLHEDMERQAVQRMVRQAQKVQQTFRKEKAKIGDHGEL